MIAGTDPRPWELLHDGTLVRAERDVADEVSLWIRHVPLRTAVYPDGGERFRLRLARCAAVVYTPHDEPPITDLAAIVASEPELGDVEIHPDGVHVSGGAGLLVVRYATLAIETDTGHAIAIDDLAAALAVRHG